MLVNIPQLGAAQLYAYRYDQLNRIKAMNIYSGVSVTNNTLINPAVALPDYNERITYDPNGNILTYKRNGTTQNGNNIDMDDLGYDYYTGTNKLKHVSDLPGNTSHYIEDIDNQSNPNNYTYDAIGNLTADNAEGITGIEWNVYGKISVIHKGSTTISYSYDATSNRISKTVGNKTTWYVRDATGNVMAVCEKGGEDNTGHLTLKELHMYGSSRLGIYKTTTDVEFGVTNEITNFERGDKFFELSNHLGNVLVTVSDKKIPHTTNGTTIDYYNADVVTAQDYYAFGMTQPGRKYQATSTSNYRYSINGQEKEKELNENITTAEYWEYDSRIGKRWNVDPKPVTELSPYSTFVNNPILHLDALGDSGVVPITNAAGATQNYNFRLNAANRYQAFNAVTNAPYNPATGTPAQSTMLNNITAAYNVLATTQDPVVQARFNQMNGDLINHNISNNVLSAGFQNLPAVQTNAAGAVTATNTVFGTISPQSIQTDLVTTDQTNTSIYNGNSHPQAEFAREYLSTAFFNTAGQSTLTASNLNVNGVFNRAGRIDWIHNLESGGINSAGGNTGPAQTAMQYADKAFIENKVRARIPQPQRLYFAAPIIQAAPNGGTQTFRLPPPMPVGIFKYDGRHL